MLYLVKLTLGDWLKNGHEKYKIYKYVSNYSVEIIQKSYIDSCNLTNIYFHKENGVENENLVWTNFQEYSVNEKITKYLKKYGIDTEKLYGTNKFIYDEDASDLIMKFISLSMPKNWEYLIIKDEFETINSFNNKNLNINFGYGLF